jgi:hypothetical protein
MKFHAFILIDFYFLILRETEDRGEKSTPGKQWAGIQSYIGKALAAWWLIIFGVAEDCEAAANPTTTTARAKTRTMSFILVTPLIFSAQ